MGFVNENIALTLPALTVESGDITGSLVLPALTLIARDADGTAELTLPALTIVSTGIGGAASTTELILPMLTLDAKMLTGYVGVLTKNLPALKVTGVGGPAPFANLSLPALTIVAQGGAVILWDVALTLPVLQLTASMITDSSGGIAPLPEEDFVAWAVNEQTKQHSKYTNWLVNSYAELNGAQFISTPDGIFELTGDDDAGTNIDAKVYWPPSKFGTDKQKRCDQAFLRIRARGNVRLIAITDEVEERIYNQDMAGFPENLHPKRVQFTRNLEGALWQLGFENVGGAGFDLQDIEVDVIVLTRRLK